ncbi:MAG: outer membrane beta-barrel protein, partial [Bacteroidetes bacterium]|nr:outer membrane beta-barrel protein [Bacteroidota bacterium]
MKFYSKVILICTVVLFFFNDNAFPQIVKPGDYNTFSAGIKAGILTFYGDVRQLKYSPDNKYKKTNTGFGFEFTKNFNNIFGVKADFLMGGLSGSTPYMNLHFNSNIIEYSASGIINLNDLISFYPIHDKHVNVYAMAGFGIVGFRSKVSTFD